MSLSRVRLSKLPMNGKASMEAFSTSLTVRAVSFAMSV